MYYCGIDVGTTRIKCGVFDEKGKMLFSDARDYGEFSKGSKTYVNIDMTKKYAFELLKESYQKIPYQAVAFSSLGESFVLLDEKDQILYLPMLYTDERGMEQANRYKTFSKQIFDISGTTPQSLYSIYKLLWIKDNEPEIYQKGKKALVVNQYMNYLLTGIPASDYSSASRTGMFDVRKKEYSVELASLFEISQNFFGTSVPCGSKIGMVRDEMKKELGFTDDVVVVAGGQDQVCSAIGSGVTEKGIGVDGMGTVECITAFFEEAPKEESFGECGYPIVPFVENQYCTYLLNYTCGSLTRWWLQSVYGKDQILSGDAFVKVESEFQEAPTGLFVLPYFGGAATPYQNITAKGCILNLQLSDSPSRIYQGILEGLTYEMKLNLELTRKYGIRIKKLIATGGGSSSDKWLQLKSSILNVPIYRPKVKEAGIAGAAILACSGMTGESLTDVAKRFIKLKLVASPNKDVSRAYKEYYAKYKKVYKAVKEFY